MAFSNATVKDLVADVILHYRRDSTRAIGSSIFTSGEVVIVLLNYEVSILIIMSTTTPSSRKCDVSQYKLRCPQSEIFVGGKIFSLTVNLF